MSDGLSSASSPNANLLRGSTTSILHENTIAHDVLRLLRAGGRLGCAATCACSLGTGSGIASDGCASRRGCASPSLCPFPSPRTSSQEFAEAREPEASAASRFMGHDDRENRALGGGRVLRRVHSRPDRQVSPSTFLTLCNRVTRVLLCCCWRYVLQRSPFFLRWLEWIPRPENRGLVAGKEYLLRAAPPPSPAPMPLPAAMGCFWGTFGTLLTEATWRLFRRGNSGCSWAWLQQVRRAAGAGALRHRWVEVTAVVPSARPPDTRTDD